MRRLAAVALAAVLPTLAFGGFRVSSYKKETSVQLGDQFWNVASSLDGKPETAWMIDPEEENKGSWIEVDVPKSEIDKIAIVAGFAKDANSFSDFARVKTMRIEVYNLTDEGDKLVLDHNVTFQDTAEWQVVDIPNTEVGGEMFGGKVRATVIDTYPGEDYPNFAISEFLVHLAEIDGATSFPSDVASGEGHDAMEMIDDSPKTFWTSPGAGAGASFMVEASGFGVSSLGIHPGPKSHARPKTVKITVNDMDRLFTLEDKNEMQWFMLPPIIGYTGSAWGEVNVEIVDTYEGAEAAVGIAEVKLKATNYEGL
jgi:hypothetical protein